MAFEPYLYSSVRWDLAGLMPAFLCPPDVTKANQIANKDTCCATQQPAFIAQNSLIKSEKVIGEEYDNYRSHR